MVLLRAAPAGRNGAGRPQVYLLRRVREMPSAPGAYVFPGGAVDPRDSAAGIDWIGPPPEQWARWLRTDPALARALVCAAVRETFEESGVLLAGSGPDEVVVDTGDAAWEERRRRLVDGALPFAELLRDHGLALRGDLLRPWARWLTPRVQRRRYDARFFTAVLPAGQRPRDVGGEADRAVWLEPAEAVRAWERGELSMLPPTIATLKELAGFGTVAEVMAARRDIVPIEPEIRTTGGRAHAVLPQGEKYPLPAPEGYA